MSILSTILYILNKRSQKELSWVDWNLKALQQISKKPCFEK